MQPESKAQSRVISGVDLTPLLDWYSENARDLPWRRSSSDPYAVWVSEVMLQQTQVATVIPYFERWMTRFPTVTALASAPLDDVLQHWAGLGYYARARNLHRAAQLIVEQYSGRVPGEYSSISKLPGIGRYTAGAILSIAYNLPAPIVDANVARVLTRLRTLDGDPKATKLLNQLYDIAEQLLKQQNAYQPSDVNQALMELGALLCTPSDPACERCPLLSQCRAATTDDPTAWPQNTPGHSTVRVIHACAILNQGDEIAFIQRPAHGLWGGLWELPRRACVPGETPSACAARAVQEILGINAHIGHKALTVRHAVTHHAITLHAFYADEWNGEPHPLDCAQFRWVNLADACTLPLASPQRAIVDYISRR